MRKNYLHTIEPAFSRASTEAKRLDTRVEAAQESFRTTLSSYDFRNNYWYHKRVMAKIFGCKENVLEKLLLDSSAGQWQRSADGKYYECVSIAEGLQTEAPQERKPIPEGFFDYSNLALAESQYFHSLRVANCLRVFFFKSPGVPESTREYQCDMDSTRTMGIV